MDMIIDNGQKQVEKMRCISMSLSLRFPLPLSLAAVIIDKVESMAWQFNIPHSRSRWR